MFRQSEPYIKVLKVDETLAPFEESIADAAKKLL